MRVIEQEGRPSILRSADLDQDGRAELIVVNSRHSRLDIYRWLAPDQRREPAADNAARPNDLPMAPEFERHEVQLEHLPLDVVVEDLDRDGRPELIILASPPNKVAVYEQIKDRKWQQRRELDLLPGELGSGHPALMLRRPQPENIELLISMENGIQQIPLVPAGRVDWLSPRDYSGRANWWTADLDGDGDFDLIEHTWDAEQALRWYECASGGELMPAHVIHDRALAGVAVLTMPGGRAQPLLLDGAANGLVRRYEFAEREDSVLGRQRSIALPGGVKAVWCGLQRDGAPSLVVADDQRPQLFCYGLDDAGWQAQRTYPAIGSIQAMAAPQAEPGTLLLWVKDAADLHVTRWRNGRLTYPEPMPQSPAAEDRKILALQSVGSTTWWVQLVDDDLHLYTWKADQPEPQRINFEGIGKVGKRQVAEHVIWLADQRLLIQWKHDKGAVLAQRDDSEVKLSEPAHLDKADIDEFRLMAVGGELRPARLTDGVLQWLGTDMHSVDQIMLKQGLKLIDYVATDEGRGWALQEDGQFIHQLKINDAGLMHLTESIRVPGGAALVLDPVLGLMLVDHDRVTNLRQGRPRKLQIIDSIDQRVVRLSGVKEATIHRVDVADIDGDGKDEVMLFDDRRHQLTVLADCEGGLQRRISWPVFEDKKYPYGGDAPMVREPRAVAALDMDGDRHQDLAMICHDRLLVYLARVGK